MKTLILMALILLTINAQAQSNLTNSMYNSYKVNVNVYCDQLSDNWDVVSDRSDNETVYITYNNVETECDINTFKLKKITFNLQIANELSIHNQDFDTREYQILRKYGKPDRRKYAQLIYENQFKDVIFHLSNSKVEKITIDFSHPKDKRKLLARTFYSLWKNSDAQAQSDNHQIKYNRWGCDIELQFTDESNPYVYNPLKKIVIDLTKVTHAFRSGEDVYISGDAVKTYIRSEETSHDTYYLNMGNTNEAEQAGKILSQIAKDCQR